MKMIEKVLGGICKKDRDEYSLYNISRDMTRDRIDRYLDKRYERASHKLLVSKFPNSDYVKGERKLINQFCYEAIVSDNPWIMNYVLLDRRIVTWYFEDECFNEMICNVLACTFSSSFISILCEYEKGRDISLRTRDVLMRNLKKKSFLSTGEVKRTNALVESIRSKNSWALEYLYCNKNYWNGFKSEDMEEIYKLFIENKLGISGEELIRMTKNMDMISKVSGGAKEDFIKSLISHNDELALKILFEEVPKDKLIEKVFIENIDIDKIKDESFKYGLQKLLLKNELEKDLEKEDSDSRGRVGKI